MHPVLFDAGDWHIYSYGLMIALGCVGGVTYMAVRGKKETGLTFDQANNLFLVIFFAALIGGKVFLFFEEPARYLNDPSALVKGTGFVFYGSFLFSVPAMLWYFRKHKLHTLKMLDVMAVTTCIVHMFGRIGCLLAGCCHGKATDFFLAITYTDPLSHANPKGVPLHATQLYEALLIGILGLFLSQLSTRRRYYGQLFVTYLAGYAVGRYVLEFLRGDGQRGFIIDPYLSHSQFIAVVLFVVAIMLHIRWSGAAPTLQQKKNRRVTVN
jgi:phosphatidylglycerol---prolipoprotein diacylglyceryl transferase